MVCRVLREGLAGKDRRWTIAEIIDTGGGHCADFSEAQPRMPRRGVEFQLAGIRRTLARPTSQLLTSNPTIATPPPHGFPS